MRCGEMKRFSLRFVDGTGREVERIVFANSKKEVLTRAGEKGIDLLSIDEKRTVSDCLTKSRCLSPEKLSFFFDQSARLTAAGIPFVEAWKLLAHDIKKREQQASLRACIAKMEGGERAAAAMEESGLFPRLACALVRAGEHSGRLDEMLRLSGDYYETAREQRAQVRRILIYPAFLFGRGNGSVWSCPFKWRAVFPFFRRFGTVCPLYPWRPFKTILRVRLVVWRTVCLSVKPSEREDSGHLT